MTKQYRQSSTLASNICNESVPVPEALTCQPDQQVPEVEEECIEATVAFGSAVGTSNLPGALESWGLMSSEEQLAYGSDPATLATVCSDWDLLDASAILGTMGANTLESLIDYAPDRVSIGLSECDATMMGLFAQNPMPYLGWMAAEFQTVAFGDLLHLFSVEPWDQLAWTGVLGGDILWELFWIVLNQIPEFDRIYALEEVRAQGKWDVLLGSMSAEHLPMVQQWLAEDMGDETGKTLEERIEAANNTARANTALAAVDGFADPDGRVTPRIRELLVLGVALPKLEGAPLASEGVLSPNQVNRALDALTTMSDKEYMRLALMLEMTGNDDSSLTQSFLLLEATAARADEFFNIPMPFSDHEVHLGSLADLEGLSDAMRGNTNADVVDMTSAVQTAAGTTGYTQQMTMGCGPASLMMARAEADPVEALSMRNSNAMTPNNVNNASARTEEQALERVSGQTAQPRRAVGDFAAITAAASNPAHGLTAAEQTAVVYYISGMPLTPAATSGLAKLQTGMGNAYPGAEALRMLSEAAANQTGPTARFGLSPVQLQTEGNSQLNVDDVTGNAVQETSDMTNLPAYNSQAHTTVQMGTWAASIRGRLTPARNRLIAGEDVVFQVRWDPAIGVGGHFMTLTNVRQDAAGAYSYLIHDTWNGTTAWITETTLVGGDLSALGFNANNRAVIWSVN